MEGIFSFFSERLGGRHRVVDRSIENSSLLNAGSTIGFIQ